MSAYTNITSFWATLYVKCSALLQYKPTDMVIMLQSMGFDPGQKRRRRGIYIRWKLKLVAHA